MYSYDTTLYLNAIEADVTIYFERDRFYPATYDSPAEGGEIEVISVEVTRLIGCTYDLQRSEVESWSEDLDRYAFDSADCQLDFFELHEYADSYDSDMGE